MNISMMSIGNILIILNTGYRGISSSSKQCFHAIELENIYRHMGLFSHVGLFNPDILTERSILRPSRLCMESISEMTSAVFHSSLSMKLLAVRIWLVKA